MPGHAEQVVALVGGQTQRAGEGGEHLRARLRTAPLLEPRVVIGRHRGQLRDLLATQPRGAPPRAGTEPDVGRLQRLPVPAQELRERIPIHVPILPCARGPNQGSSIPR